MTHRMSKSSGQNLASPVFAAFSAPSVFNASLGMNRILLLFGLLTSVLCLPSSGTELTDLGQGLAYLRVKSLAEAEKSVRSNVPADRALVLDLRYCVADEASAAMLRDSLAARRNAPPPLLVLVSPATPALIARALGPLPAKTLVLGLEGSAPAPTVVIRGDADTDRRAYDAADGGMPLATLINGKLDKERYDEATLVREFTNGNRDSRPPPAPNPAAPATPEQRKPEPVPVLTDRVLQRAVQLHRALLAIRQR